MNEIHNNSFDKSKKNLLTKYLKNKWVAITLSSGVIMNAANWFLIVRKVGPTEELVYLHYNIYFGVDLIGRWYQLYIMPFIGTLIIALNAYIGFILFKREPRIAKLILSINLFLQIVLVTASLLILRQNS